MTRPANQGDLPRFGLLLLGALRHPQQWRAMVDMGVQFLGEDRVVVCQPVPASGGLGIRCRRREFPAALSFTEIVALIHDGLIAVSRTRSAEYVRNMPRMQNKPAPTFSIRTGNGTRDDWLQPLSPRRATRTWRRGWNWSCDGPSGR